MTRRRAIQTVVLFLLLISGGAIVNVAVAWGCVVWTERPYVFHPHESTLAWPVPSPDLPRINWIDSFVTMTLSEVYAHSEEVGDSSVDRDAYTVDQRDFRAGWPMRSMHLWRTVRLPVLVDISNLHWSEPKSWREGIAVPSWMPFRQPNVLYFPTQPIWPGFAINTIFYAAVLWMLFAFPFVVRRRTRIKRGLCPACAYPVGTSPVCTECGGAVKKSEVSSQKSEDVQP